MESSDSAAPAAAAATPAPAAVTTTTPPATSTQQQESELAAEIPGQEERDLHDQEFERISADFSAFLSTLDAHSEVKSEVTALFSSIAKSHRRIDKHFRDYSGSYGSYIANVASAQEALRTSIIDQQTVKNLQGQIKKAQDLVDGSNKREDYLKDELKTVKAEINSLSNTLKQGVGLSSLQEKTINELMSVKEAAVRDLDAEMEKIVYLRTQLSEVAEKIRQCDEQKRAAEHEIYELKDRNLQKKSDIDNELRSKERLERDLRELRVVVAVKTQEAKSKQDNSHRITEDINFLELQIKSQKQLLEKLLKDQETLVGRTTKLQQDYNAQSKLTNDLTDQNEKTAKELRGHEIELARTRQEIKKISKVRAVLIKKNKDLEEQKSKAETDKRDMKARIDMLTEDNLNNKRLLEVEKKTLDDCRRERDVLGMNISKTTDATAKHISFVLTLKQTRRNVEIEVQQYLRETSEALRRVEKLEHERNVLHNEIERVQEQSVQLFEGIKQQEMDVYDMKRNLGAATMQLKHQQNVYEAIQTDRNLHSRHLIESQHEIGQMKRQLRLLNFQINGLKEDIVAKDEALKKEANEHQKLQQDIETTTEEIKSLKNQNELAQTYIRTQTAEEMKLQQFVKEAELEKGRQETALQTLANERDNLSSQMIGQNNELRKVYDKIKTNFYALIRSEKHYVDRVRTIDQLDGEIKAKKLELAGYHSQTSDLPERRKLVHQLQKELSVEEARLRALEEELRHTVNLHRWRKMEGSNPKAFEMIQILQSLRRKLIERTKEDHQKEQQIQRREQLYLTLKEELAKQSGPEAAEQILDYEQVLKDKRRQLRHMDAELNMYQAQVREYKHSIGSVERRLGEIREAYVAQRCR